MILNTLEIFTANDEFPLRFISFWLIHWTTGKLLAGGDFVDNNEQSGSFDGYVVASTEDGVVNANLQQQVSNNNHTKSRVLESYLKTNGTTK